MERGGSGVRGGFRGNWSIFGAFWYDEEALKLPRPRLGEMAGRGDGRRPLQVWKSRCVLDLP